MAGFCFFVTLGVTADSATLTQRKCHRKLPKRDRACETNDPCVHLLLALSYPCRCLERKWWLFPGFPGINVLNIAFLFLRFKPEKIYNKKRKKRSKNTHAERALSVGVAFLPVCCVSSCGTKSRTAACVQSKVGRHFRLFVIK